MYLNFISLFLRCFFCNQYICLNQILSPNHFHSPLCFSNIFFDNKVGKTSVSLKMLFRVSNTEISNFGFFIIRQMLLLLIFLNIDCWSVSYICQCMYKQAQFLWFQWIKKFPTYENWKKTIFPSKSIFFHQIICKPCENKQNRQHIFSKLRYFFLSQNFQLSSYISSWSVCFSITLVVNQLFLTFLSILLGDWYCRVGLYFFMLAEPSKRFTVNKTFACFNWIKFSTPSRSIIQNNSTIKNWSNLMYRCCKQVADQRTDE